MAPPRLGFWKRLFGRRPAAIVPEPAADVAPPAEDVPEPLIERSPEPEPVPVADSDAPEPVLVADSDAPSPATSGLDPKGVLDAALDSLGMAHHRPFSRG